MKSKMNFDLCSNSNLFSYLYTTINKVLLRCGCLLVVIGVILNTTVCDLCHLVSPKVVGIVAPFLQSAFASSKHTGSVCAIIILVICNLLGSNGSTKDSNSLASTQLSGAPSNTNFIKILYMRMNESVPSRLTCVQ